MELTIPQMSLVVLIGASGSGKSTFAHRHFKPTEILSSDVCRGLVCDDETSQAATKDAFDLLHYITAMRLAAGRLVVVDATNVLADSRKPLVELAKRFHVLPVAIVLDMPERLCQDRNSARPDRNFGPHVVRNHVRALRQSLRGLQREGFRSVSVIDDPALLETVVVKRERLFNDKADDHGPFDIVGDIHGCFDELCELLARLGYKIDADDATVLPPGGRKVVFVGDLVDRGPKSPQVLRLAMQMVRDGTALCVPGNHDAKLLRKLNGRDVQIAHGLAQTLEQLAVESEEFVSQVKRFLDGLVSHYVLDDGKLVVAHAGMKAEMQGRASGRVRDFALYGDTTGETDEFGLPVRYPWATEYRGKAVVVYGHTPVAIPEWLNGTINIDTGCVFGGKLTALRWPERELVSVPARQMYSEPSRPFLPDPSPFQGEGRGEASAEPVAMTAQQAVDDILDIEEVLGKRFVETRLHNRVTIQEENAIAALEVMSRFAANPKWLIYLPPTMSPPETSELAGLLEHPAEAFAYYGSQGVATVVCEEKHMGSRAVVIICRDEAAALKRFGVVDEGIGICYTRTGRRFFDDAAQEQHLLLRVRSALDAAGFWADLSTDWACLDCELMPWSAKAQDLIRKQYAGAGCAATAALSAAVTQLSAVKDRSPEAAALAEQYAARQSNTGRFVDAYRRYCWTVGSVDDLKLAPFHILATESGVHIDKDHLWHMNTIAAFCAHDPILIATPYRTVAVDNADAVDAGVRWWTELTDRGGEGMVVKPIDFIARGSKGGVGGSGATPRTVNPLRGGVQPAVKCRGREYLRIIYGPDYTMDENLIRLRSRGLGAKRSLALREFALGIEALERFVRREPLRRVHECVFGVLALESEPVDPRL